MFINDVLVPYFFLDICLSAYLKVNQSEWTDSRFQDADPYDPRVSPVYASDDVLKKLPHNIIILNAGIQFETSKQ